MFKVFLPLILFAVFGLSASAQTRVEFSEICRIFCEDSTYRPEFPAPYKLLKIGKDSFVLEVYRSVWDSEKEELVRYRQFSTSYKVSRVNDSCVCKPHGLKMLFNKEGQVLFEDLYSEGLRDGFELRYFASGKLSSVSSFVEGKRQGAYQSYYKSGTIECVGFYHQGAKSGDWSFFSPKGFLEFKGSYNSDYSFVETNYAGDTIVYRDNANKIIKKLEFREGIDSLQKLMRVERIKGLVFPVSLHRREGEWLYYDEKGNVIRKEYYRRGELLRTED